MQAFKSKESWRQQYRKKRGEIPFSRRHQAHQEMVKFLPDYLKNYPFVLSYSNFGDEFETFQLNQKLAFSKQLLLPKIVQNHLEIYQVTDLQTQLQKNSLGILEPDPKTCKKIKLEEISFLLVPGIVFDQKFSRLGYGKGYYDRFLASLPPQIGSYGLGFYEQFTLDPLPVEENDIPLKGLFLF